MSSIRSSTRSGRSRPRPSDGLLARAVRRTARVSARRPKAMVALWMLLVVGLTIGGGMAGTRYIAAAGSGTGESARADRRIHAAGLEQPGVEQILVRSGDRAATAAAAADLERRVERLPVARSVTGPRDTPPASSSRVSSRSSSARATGRRPPPRPPTSSGVSSACPSRAA